VRDIRSKPAGDHGLATDERFSDRADNMWTIERQLVQRDLVDDLYASAADAPCERRAVMAGGLGGAGKSTVLQRHAGVDRSQYLTINPDDIKEAMARRGLIPEIEGLSPMEASDLVDAESSYVAQRLARRAMDDGKNLIWDITMSSTRTTEDRLDDLDRAGYSTNGIFVDIGIAEAVRRADTRHRLRHEDYRAGLGFGGRYVPPEVIEAQADPEWGSVNRRTFEQVKKRFAEWASYDDLVTGRDPMLIEAGHGPVPARSGSPGETVSEVTDLVARYKAGELSLDELAARFRTRRWPSTPSTLRPTSYLEMAAQTQGDAGSDVPGSFDDVEAAFFRHELSLEEYELLRRAAVEAPSAEHDL
jgi:hypothetical protein